MKIILIGFMGAGKSCIGRLLARKLHLPFFDMDKLVVKKSGRKNINEIFQKDGETFFRNLELTIAKNLKYNKKSCVATGGGVVINNNIMNLLKNQKSDIVVFLKTSLKTINNRLKNTHDRPHFSDRKNTEKLFKDRSPLYKFYADIIVSTDNKELNNITGEIIERINSV